MKDLLKELSKDVYAPAILSAGALVIAAHMLGWAFDVLGSSYYLGYLIATIMGAFLVLLMYGGSE